MLTISSILAFLASTFFVFAGLRSGGSPEEKAFDSLRLTLGFGAANALSSCLAYWAIESLPIDYSLDAFNGLPPIEPPSATSSSEKKKKEKKKRRFLQAQIYGRRALLLFSLAGGTLLLLALSILLTLKDTNSAKLPLVVIFLMLFTLAYSPGAGAVPFLYSAEVWPNEGRGEI
jgi:hypothetical protein